MQFAPIYDSPAKSGSSKCCEKNVNSMNSSLTFWKMVVPHVVVSNAEECKEHHHHSHSRNVGSVVVGNAKKKSIHHLHSRKW